MLNVVASCEFERRNDAIDADGDVVASKGASAGYGGSLFPAVGIACLGSILFGYHLG